MTWLAGQLKDNVAASVTYIRGAYSVTLSATLGSQLLRLTDAGGNTKIERTDRDIVFSAADLILNGSATTPQRGDKFRVTFGSTTTEYAVMAPDGEPPWRYADSHQTMIRAHGKYYGTV